MNFYQERFWKDTRKSFTLPYPSQFHQRHFAQVMCVSKYLHIPLAVWCAFNMVSFSHINNIHAVEPYGTFRMPWKFRNPKYLSTQFVFEKGHLQTQGPDNTVHRLLRETGPCFEVSLQLCLRAWHCWHCDLTNCLSGSSWPWPLSCSG